MEEMLRPILKSTSNILSPKDPKFEFVIGLLIAWWVHEHSRRKDGSFFNT